MSRSQAAALAVILALVLPACSTAEVPTSGSAASTAARQDTAPVGYLAADETSVLVPALDAGPGRAAAGLGAGRQRQRDDKRQRGAGKQRLGDRHAHG